MAADISALGDEQLEAYINESLTRSGIAFVWCIGLTVCILMFLSAATVMNSRSTTGDTMAAVLLLWLALSTVGIILTPFLWSRAARQDRLKRVAFLDYSLDEEALIRWDALDVGLSSLSTVQYLRYSFYLVENDPRNLFALPCRLIKNALPEGITSNLQPWTLRISGVGDYLFFPDRMLVCSAPGVPSPTGQRFRSRLYRTLDRMSVFPTEETIYDGAFPDRGQLLRWDYLHTRRDGSPDRRYADNPRHPVMQAVTIGFGLAEVNSNWWLCTEEIAMAPVAARALSIGMQLPLSDSHGLLDEEHQPDEQEQGEIHPNAPSAYGVLGLRDGALPAEVSDAYRRMVREYHPDRVATMGPEIREVAERKMKEINAAYESLKAGVK